MIYSRKYPSLHRRPKPEEVKPENAVEMKPETTEPLPVQEEVIADFQEEYGTSSDPGSEAFQSIEEGESLPVKRSKKNKD